MLTSCSGFGCYLKIKSPHASVLCVSTGTKCSAEHEYADIQACHHFFFFFFTLASSFLRFWALHRFKTHRHSFTQICPGIVLLFWAHGHAHITCVQDPISITKLIQTQRNQRIIWDWENQIDQTDYALSCSLCRSKTDSETISTWFSSQHWCKRRQPECGRFRYSMHRHRTEHLLQVAHIAVCPQGGTTLSGPGRGRSLFADPGQVSWSDGMSCSVCRAAIIVNQWLGDKNTVVALAGGERRHDMTECVRNF